MPQFRIDIAHFFGDCSMPDDGSGQGSVVREDPLVLHDLADLAAVAFYSIDRVNEPPSFLSVLIFSEISI